MYLAELNEHSIVVGVKMVKEFIDDDKHIFISEEEYGNILGMRYINGQFVASEKSKEEIKDENLASLKQEYLRLIRDAKDLGEDEEVIRLQQEYQQKKTETESQ